MKPSVHLAIASILALTAAVPLEKRVLVVETVTDVVVQTVQSTTTIWVKPTQAHIAAHAHHHGHKHPAPSSSSTLTLAPAPVPTPPSSSAEAPSLPATTSASTSPQQPAPVVQPAPKKAAAAPQPAPVVNNAPSSPAAAPAPAPAPQSPSPAPAPSTPQPQSNSYSSPSANSGSTADCGQVGGTCSGDITFYDTGLGACGWTNDGTTEKVFALAHGMMGAQSNGNPFCGRQAEISLNGKTVVGKLVDKCGGCEGQSIDLSHALFDVLAPESAGRISDVKWHFID